LSIFGTNKLNSSTKFVHALIPQDCALCGAECGAELICEQCQRALPYHDVPCCPQCALPTPDGGRCGRCLAHPPAFDRTRAAFDYRYPLAELVHAFKYGSNLALGKFLADALIGAVRAETWPDLMLPMPLHPARLKERGFNQAAEIARRVALATGTPLALDDLRKIRDTAAQVNLPWKERQANVRGAFVCETSLSGQRVVVVDDVMTTGATLGEAAKLLKKCGAASVDVWVVARTLPDAAPST
jgi:ComF family protein